MIGNLSIDLRYRPEGHDPVCLASFDDSSLIDWILQCAIKNARREARKHDPVVRELYRAEARLLRRTLKLFRHTGDRSGNRRQK